MFLTDADANVANQFSDGNPSTGTPGTTINAVWLNAVQNELANFITAMGLTLTKADSTQLRTALLAFTTWALNRAGDQALTKGNSGKLQFGTSIATDLELLRAGAAMLALTASGIDAKTQKIVNVVDPTLAQDAATKGYVDAAAVPVYSILQSTTGWTYSVRTSHKSAGFVVVTLDATAGAGASWSSLATLPAGRFPTAVVLASGYVKRSPSSYYPALFRIMSTDGSINLMWYDDGTGFTGPWTIATGDEVHFHAAFVSA